MPLVTVTNPHAAMETAPSVTVNGKVHPIVYDKKIDLPDEVVEALRNSSLTLIEHGEPENPTTESPTSEPAGSGDAAAGAEPGGEAAGGGETEDTTDTDEPDVDAFDPEAVILGTVPVVTERLANLTKDQLEAVAKAEQDREEARVGVLKAVDHALAAFTPAE